MLWHASSMARERVDELAAASAGQRFQLCRRGSSWPSQPGPSEGLERGLWSADGYAHVRTQRADGTTPVRFEVFDAHPDEPVLRGSQHVAEVSLAPGGHLEVFDGDAERTDPPRATVEVPPGPLRVRVAWSGLVDGEGDSTKAIVVQLWPEEPHEPLLVRCWHLWELPPPQATSPGALHQIEGRERVRSKLAVLEHVGDLSPPYPPMPYGGPRSAAHAIYRDPNGSGWWVDGEDGRRMLRYVIERTARDLLDQVADPPKTPWTPRTQEPGMRTTEYGPNRRYTIRVRMVGERRPGWNVRPVHRNVDYRVVTPLSERRAIGLAIERFAREHPDGIWQEIDVIDIEEGFTWGHDDVVDHLTSPR